MRPTTPPFTRDLKAPELEAMIEVMFLAAFADGDFGQEERAQFLQSVATLTERSVSAEPLEGLVTRMTAELSEEGRPARLATIKERLTDPGTRKAALAFAVRLALADGIIRTSERELILEVAEALEVDRDEAANLVASLSR